MAEGAMKKRVARAMADLCISCAGFRSCNGRLAKGSKKKGSTRSRDTVADLPDDILVDILSRVPIKSLCQCKLVCKRWRGLISHHEHHKKLPQTLDGFFYNTVSEISMSHVLNLEKHFYRPDYFTVSGAVDPFIDPSLSFLSGYVSIDIKDSSNGLLLCHCWKRTYPVTMDYVVCNPAMEKWVVVPDSGWSSKVASTSLGVTRLGFDPAVSSHFHVFEFIPDDIWYIDDPDIDVEKDANGRIEVVAVYFSRTGVWSLNKNEDSPICTDCFAMHTDSKSVFFNGVLHLATFYEEVLAIDVEGKILRVIPLPISLQLELDDPVNVYISQGHLYLASQVYDKGSVSGLSVWVLEDYNSENWTLKYNVDLLHLFGAGYYSKFGNDFSIISVHPEHDLIFMVCGRKQTLMAYEMDHMRLRFISQLGWYGLADYSPYPHTPYPYVPLFSESLAEDEQ